MAFGFAHIRTLAIELFALSCFFSRGGSVTSAPALLISLQVGILLTGNYAFFNLLSIALCLWAFDDFSFARLNRVLQRISGDCRRCGGPKDRNRTIDHADADRLNASHIAADPRGGRPVNRMLTLLCALADCKFLRPVRSHDDHAARAISRVERQADLEGVLV